MVDCLFVLPRLGESESHLLDSTSPEQCWLWFIGDFISYQEKKSHLKGKAQAPSKSEALGDVLILAEDQREDRSAMIRAKLIFHSRTGNEAWCSFRFLKESSLAMDTVSPEGQVILSSVFVCLAEGNFSFPLPGGSSGARLFR